MALYMTHSQLQQMIAHAAAELGNEACGFLAGRAGRVFQVYPVTNAENSPLRFRMDPAEQVRSIVAIEEAGWELLGIFHSHPSGPPTPSVADQAQASYPEAVCVILAPDATGDWQARGFRLIEGHGSEVPLQIVGEYIQP